MRLEWIDRYWFQLLCAIILLGVALRLAFIFYLGYDRMPLSDSFLHYKLALSIASGNGFTIGGGPFFSRMPGYPYAIAPIMAVFANPFAARLFNLVLSVLTIALTYILGMKLWGKKTGLAAAFLLAVYPSAILFNFMLVGENLAILLNLIAVLALYYGINYRGYKALLLAAAAGFCWGLAALNVANILLIIPIVPLVLWAVTRDWRRSVMIGAIVIAAIIMTLAPWTIRNYNLSGRFIPIRTQSGLLLYGANCQKTLDIECYQGKHVYFMKDWEAFKRGGWKEWEIDDHYREKTVEYLRDNPGSIPKLLWYKFYHYWTPYKRFAEPLYRYALLGFAGPVLMFTVIGIIFIIRRGPRHAWYLLIPFFASQIGCLIYFAGERFRYPAQPFILLVAAVGLVYIIRFIASKKSVGS